MQLMHLLNINKRARSTKVVRSSPRPTPHIFLFLCLIHRFFTNRTPYPEKMLYNQNCKRAKITKKNPNNFFTVCSSLSFSFDGFPFSRLLLNYTPVHFLLRSYRKTLKISVLSILSHISLHPSVAKL